MAVSMLESEGAFQDKSLSTFHATMHTMTHTSAAKIVESHTGRAFIKHLPAVPPVQLGMSPL